MPRRPREKSATGIYHVILRGINRQTIFEDDEDYLKMLDSLEVCREKSGSEIFAYCLMSNHGHFLLKEGTEDLGAVFRRLGPSFVYWYNWKYSRRGHLFQGRYKSEVVEKDKYFLTVIRYIHQNPVKAGIVKRVGDYRWSSYQEYISGKRGICNIDYPLGLFSGDREKALSIFIVFNAQKNKDRCLTYDRKERPTDAEGRFFINQIAQVKSPLELQGLEGKRRDGIIKQCREKGLSIRQIARLTGVSFGVIRRIE
jgi:putative transposase